MKDGWMERWKFMFERLTTVSFFFLARFFFGVVENILDGEMERDMVMEMAMWGTVVGLRRSRGEREEY